MKKRKKLPRLCLALLILALAALSFSWGAKTTRNTAPEPPAGESAGSPETTAAPAGETHSHVWEPVWETVYREAMTEDVWVLDKEAWLEPKDAARSHCACRCGFSGSYDTVNEHIRAYRDAWLADQTPETEAVMQQHFFDTSNLDDWIVHEAEGHWETQTVREAGEELAVTGYRCTVCGAGR